MVTPLRSMRTPDRSDTLTLISEEQKGCAKDYVQRVCTPSHALNTKPPDATSLRYAILLRLRTSPSLPWLERSLLDRSSPCYACVPAHALLG